MANWDYNNIQEQSNSLLNWFDIIIAAKNHVAESISYSSEGMAHKNAPIEVKLWDIPKFYAKFEETNEGPLVHHDIAAWSWKS